MPVAQAPRPPLVSPATSVPPAHSQTTPARPFAGTAGRLNISREELRRLVEEDRRRKKKLMFIFLPAAAALMITAALLLLFLVFLKGVSPEEYKERAVAIHDRLLTELHHVDNEWSRINYSSKPESECYEGLLEECRNAEAAIAVAMGDIQDLEMPKECQPLREELLSYYGSADDYFTRAVAVFAFAAEWSRIWEEWIEVPYESDKVNEYMSLADAVALIDKDIAQLDRYYSRFQELASPPECKGMYDGTLSLLQEQRTLFERLKRAVINCDLRAYDVLMDDWESYDIGALDRLLKIGEDITSFHDECLDLLERGYRLKRKLSGGEEGGEEEEGENVTLILPLLVAVGKEC